VHPLSRARNTALLEQGYEIRDLAQVQRRTSICPIPPTGSIFFSGP
jgi:hypothetical protein